MLQSYKEQQAKSLQLINFNKNDNTLFLNQEALEILEQYDENNIAFVSIVGLYRTGKSTLINKLLNIDKGIGFKVESSTKACTQGIWMWPDPQYNEQENLYIFFIDTEGSSNVESTNTFNNDAKIFTLTMLISSFFMFNSKGCINESAISQLGLTCSLSKNIVVDEYGSFIQDDDLWKYSPCFMWVLRDFVLEITDQKGRNISENQYLENSLNDNNVTDKQQKNIRKCILQYFKDRHCITFVQPVNEIDKLQKLDNIPQNQLKQQFITQINNLRKIIFQKTKAKIFKNKPLNARMMCSLLISFVDNINCKQGVPNLQAAWENIIINECDKAKQVGLLQYESDLREYFQSKEKAIEFVVYKKNLEKYEIMLQIDMIIQHHLQKEVKFIIKQDRSQLRQCKKEKKNSFNQMKNQLKRNFHFIKLKKLRKNINKNNNNLK
ncbi:hypothetical protein IMG5_169250 [Ichthyophthirius multifiliis]|uniref:GB1/RHD3-type G domain-containing protein n=1 Tax=Ichthyophthirius multifiliis TaxID=5932 RepID=G0R195_ICHMU|nr:hypothetical protein IMG5_169250 [Ichthyophthirius multifiliis]EGR28728.1 hypothetical protein IMG5_169250 [Ichthyophthirius multifiliis]|eukprot:XP_004029964.1 hypothetical protein IMG5_169250 [Ichthyophthirius multifiliis]